MPRSVADLLAHADDLADRFESLDPNEGSSRVTGLGELFLAVQDRAASERRLAEAVRAARGEGTPWVIIGKLVGTSGEAARQRFGGSLPPKKATKAKRTKKAAKAAVAKTAAKKATVTKAATTKAAPAKKTTRSRDYALAAHADRKQSAGHAVSRDATTGRFPSTNRSRTTSTS